MNDMKPEITREMVEALQIHEREYDVDGYLVYDEDALFIKFQYDGCEYRVEYPGLINHETYPIWVVDLAEMVMYRKITNIEFDKMEKELGLR